jgi:hypothetical protein
MDSLPMLRMGLAGNDKSRAGAAGYYCLTLRGRTANTTGATGPVNAPSHNQKRVGRF